MRRSSLSACGGERRCGQAAVYDALMFFVVMIVASSLVHVYHTQMAQGEGIDEFARMQEVAASARLCIGQMTLHNTSYLDAGGDVVPLPPMSTRAQDLLLLELGMLVDGLPRDNFLALEKDLWCEMRALIPGQYVFALDATARIDDATSACVRLSPDNAGEIPQGVDLCCEEWGCSLPGHDGVHAAFRLMLWK